MVLVLCLAVSAGTFAGAAPLAPAAGVTSACSFQVVLTADRTAGATPLLVHFNATVTAGAPTEFNWSFGDGSVWDDVGVASSAPLHRYSQPGTYSASVDVREPGCTASASLAVTVVAGPLTVVMTARPSSGPAPLSVVFNATVSGGSGTYGTAVWAFGDGGVGSGYDLVYTYAQPGRYTAVLNVTDSAGHWAVATASIGVSGSAASATGLGAAGIPPWMVVGIAAGGGVFVAALSYLRWRARPAEPGTTFPERSAPSRDPGEIDGPPPPSGTPLPNGEGRTETSSRSLRSARTAAEPEGGIMISRDPGPPGVPSDQLRLTERTILHIGRQGALGPNDLAPIGLTQAGMAEVLGIGQNSLTNVLRRLVAAGVLEQEVRHVRGRPRRLRVYRFTARGETIYRDLRQRTSRSTARHE